MKNVKTLIKALHKFSEYIIIAFLVWCLFIGISNQISISKPTVLTQIVGLALLVYLMFWDDDSIIGKLIKKNKK